MTGWDLFGQGKGAGVGGKGAGVREYGVIREPGVGVRGWQGSRGRGHVVREPMIGSRGKGVGVGGMG